MSCFPKHMLPQIAAISGVPVDRLGQMVDAARQNPHPPLPLDPEVVDAIVRGLPAAHDSCHGAAVLQMVAQGLRLALRQSRDRLPAARELALLTTLTGTVMPDVPPPDPALVQAMRADLCLRPAPLPLTLPDDPDARRRAVLAAARVSTWADDDAARIASDHTLVGFAWALGVQHPRIRAVVDESIMAAAAALIAGAADPVLLRRVVRHKSPQWAAQVLVTSNRTDRDLIAKAAEWAATATDVLVARPDIADRDLIAKAAEWAATATDVLVARPDIADRDLVRAAAREPWTAVKVLVARQDIADPALVRAAANDPRSAAEVLVRRQDIAAPALVRAAAREPWTAVKVLVARQDIADPALVRAAANDPRSAAQVLAARQDITTPDLITAAAREPEMAAQVLIHRPDRADRDLITAAAREPEMAAQVLVARRDITDPVLIAAAANHPRSAAQVLAARHDITDPALLAAAANHPRSAAQVLAARSDLRSRRDVLNLVRSNRTVAHAVVDALGPYPSLWQALPASLRDEIADHYQMTPNERAWIESITTRTPPVWTDADDHLAARFSWHHALRASLRTEAIG